MPGYQVLPIGFHVFCVRCPLHVPRAPPLHLHNPHHPHGCGRCGPWYQDLPGPTRTLRTTCPFAASHDPSRLHPGRWDAVLVDRPTGGLSLPSARATPGPLSPRLAHLWGIQPAQRRVSHLQVRHEAWSVASPASPLGANQPATSVRTCSQPASQSIYLGCVDVCIFCLALFCGHGWLFGR